jgi:5-hydroxyisourate hydrolase
MISTHVLDTSRGRPAAGVPVLLERVDGVDGSGARREVGRGITDADGRVRELVPSGVAVDAGTYCLTFDTAKYAAASNQESFYPRVAVFFTVSNPSQHHHVPLLLSPYGYSTYRGS